VRMTTEEFVRFAEGFRPATVDPAGAAVYADRAASLRGVASVRHGTVISCGYFGGSSLPAGLQVELSVGGGGVATFVEDHLEMETHGWTAATHVDALGHAFLDGTGFGASPRPDPEQPDVSVEHTINAGGFGNGLISRALVLDLPWVLGVERLEPGFAAGQDLVDRALAQLNLSPEPGDVLVVPTGALAHADRIIDAAGRIPAGGLSLECAPWVQSSRFSLLVSDVGTDPVPSEVEGVATPWHLLALARLGLRLVDNAQLAVLVDECRRLRQWTGMFVLAPLGIPGATGSPANPLITL
jgi:hypothetical protein